MSDFIERNQIRLAAMYSNGDARIWLEILRRGALLAEDEGEG